MIEIRDYDARFEDAVVELVVGIQRGEFGIDISEEDQPDLRSIPSFYQRGAGNFWIALDGERLIGTLALLEIGERRAAIRKMFVSKPYRGSSGTASRLLGALFERARAQGLEEIFLGTTVHYHAAHRFYEKHGFTRIEKTELPASFPVMEVDTLFYWIAVRDFSGSGSGATEVIR